MTGKRPWFLWLPAVVVAAAGIFFLWPRPTIAPASKTVSVRIGRSNVRAEVAATSEAQTRGLSGRAQLPDGTGMLFLFPAPGRPGFWMRVMRFPLDLIWINGDAVSEVTPNLPLPPDGRPPPTYTPSAPITAVLEVAAGFSQQWKIRAGDAVTIGP